MTEPAAPAPVLEVRDLRFAHDDGRQALDGVSIDLGGGEALGVVGPNGAGKTTLFLALLGIHRPIQGSVRIFGTEVAGAAGTAFPADIRRRIGLVFQDTDDQLFSATVFDDVAFGPLNFGLPRGEIHARVDTALAAVELAGYGPRTPHHLSAGEKRRVAIATVISYEPDILILDEPTSDLDPRGRRQIAALLARMPQAKLIASHDHEFLRRTTTRVVLLDQGRVCACGPTAEILGDAALLDRHGL